MLFAIALAARAAWGVAQWARAQNEATLEFPDEEQYWGMAGSLWRGDGLRDELGFRATRMPLYPTMLAPFTAFHDGIASARVAHWLMGALAAVLTAVLAAPLGRAVATTAGLLVAFDPFLTFFSSLLLTETPFVAALLALWIAVSNAGRSNSPAFHSWIVVGVLSAICVYLRESSAGLVVLALLFAAAWRRFEKHAVVGAATALVIVVLALTPWAWRNQRVTGDWCWLTHRGGISLYDGVRPEATGASDLGQVKHGEAVRGLSEVEWDRYFRREAIAAIRAEPGRVARLALSKLRRMWNPFPNVETYQSRSMRIVSAGWMIPVFVLAAAGIGVLVVPCRGEDVRWAAYLLAPAVYFSLLHSVFVGSVRYRLPAMPMLEILAAVALVTAYNRWRRGRGLPARDLHPLGMESG